ncbi:MAG: RagB/SusD family nutrient uptake outer membrane protein [Tannerella sp.]|jgi:hypothetical protein|nr:RagB/SusD family nutrient uptake outer membrane protein [Tannerella sp.]
MKSIKFNIIGIFLTASLILCGCEDFLDRAPLASLSQASFFGSKRDISTWHAGIYVSLQNTLNSGHLLWGDARADLYGSTGPSYIRVNEYTNNLDATQGDYSWQNLYNVIMKCNTAIAYYPTVPDASETDYNDFLGQAYGLRALMYFYAIRIWGDVPIVDQLWDGLVSSSQIPRSPVSDVKTLILSDLDEALKLLGADVGGARKYYFNRAAAYALKTDVHLWFGENEQALEASEWFFTGATGTFRLITNMDDYRTIFIDPQTSTETVFTLYWNTVETGVGCNWCGFVGSKGGTGVSVNNGFRIGRNLFNQFVDRVRSEFGTDARFVANYDTVGIYNTVGTPGNRPPIVQTHYTVAGAAAILNKNIKYSPRPTGTPPPVGTWYTVLPLSVEEGGTDGRCQILYPIYRFADVYTLRAEALNRLGRGTEALQLVNDIRRRVGYTADATTEVTTNNRDSIEWLILEERKLEFITEGKRWFDLRRWGDAKLIQYMDPIIREHQIELGNAPTGFTHPGRVLAPIYFREFEANPALVQNEPYGASD